MVAVMPEEVAWVRRPDQPLFEFVEMLMGGGIDLGVAVSLVKKLKEQPALVLAIEAWDAEANLVEDAPQADGLLGTAAAEAKRIAKAMTHTERG